MVERVKKYLGAMRSFVFRPDPTGRAMVKETKDNLGRIVAPSGQTIQAQLGQGSKSGAGAGKGASQTALSGIEDPNGIRAKVIKRTDVPLVEWVNWTDPSMRYKAAEYVPSENKIHANKTFVVFTAMADRYIRKYGDIPGADAEIKRLVHEAFELELVSKVMHAKALESLVGKTMFDQMTAPPALTTAVSGLVLVDHWLNAKIGGKYGKGKSVEDVT